MQRDNNTFYIQHTSICPIPVINTYVQFTVQQFYYFLIFTLRQIFCTKENRRTILEGADKWVMSKFRQTTILRPFFDIFERSKIFSKIFFPIFWKNIFKKYFQYQSVIPFWNRETKCHHMALIKTWFEEFFFSTSKGGTLWICKNGFCSAGG